MSNLFVLNANIDTIICDIEGTTTSIAFVKVNHFKIKLNIFFFILNFNLKGCAVSVCQKYFERIFIQKH